MSDDLNCVSVLSSKVDQECYQCGDCIEAGMTFVRMKVQEFNTGKIVPHDFCQKCGCRYLGSIANSYHTTIKNVEEANVRDKDINNFIEMELAGKILSKPKDFVPVKFLTNTGFECPKKKGTTCTKYYHSSGIYGDSVRLEPCHGMTYCDHLGKVWYNALQQQHLCECWYPHKVRHDEY